VTTGITDRWRTDRPLVAGIVNVTPDSFSDGGRFPDSERAVAHGLALLAAGADVLDVGGESTRPGAAPVVVEDELARIVPVIGALVAQHPGVAISVDTSKAAVARAALAAGACLVNDVSAARDGVMLATVAATGAGIVLMHMRGEPRTMQSDTDYDDIVAEVHAYLAERAEAALAAGIARERIFLDPGIGFGKSVDGNLALLAALPDLAALGFPVVVGASRKSFIGALSGAKVNERVSGSLAALVGALELPRVMLRVHDVAETAQFLTVLLAIRRAA
jgi:dihydropteroate synthase